MILDEDLDEGLDMKKALKQTTTKHSLLSNTSARRRNYRD